MGDAIKYDQLWALKENFKILGNTRIHFFVRWEECSKMELAAG